MRLNILIGGKAGQGIDAAASIISRALSKKGLYIFNYRDYPSLIKGGQNFNIISVSEEKIGSYESGLDLIAALDEQTVKDHKKNLKKGGLLLKTEDFEIEDKYRKVANVFILGVLFKYLGLDLGILKGELKERFKGKKFLPLDLEAAEEGYSQGKETEGTKLKLPKKKKLKIMTGSEGIAQGAIDSGIDIYLAYPMTPATPVLHLLAGKQKGENILVFQPENELAVANAGLGAAHTGAKAMVGTSGGGYDLMQEALSMQGISEIPLVVYLAQRPGPGSGVPTYSTQGDLHIAVKGGHGEFPRVTIAPGDAVECRRKTNEAFYFAEKFRALAIILGDKHVAESEYTFTQFEEKLEVERNIEKKKGGVFEHYKITEDENSPRSVPGLTVVKSSSYEHNERGITTEEPTKIKQMNDKRLKKEKTIEKEVRKFDTYKIHGDRKAKTLVVGWGSTKGAILDAIKGLPVKFLQIIYIRPFPTEIKEELEKAEKVLLVENNATGLLGDLIAEQTGFRIPEKNKILKYDARPFASDQLKKKIEKKGGIEK